MLGSKRCSKPSYIFNWEGMLSFPIHILSALEVNRSLSFRRACSIPFCSTRFVSAAIYFSSSTGSDQLPPQHQDYRQLLANELDGKPKKEWNNALIVNAIAEQGKRSRNINPQRDLAA
jgi:hypothetical protein